MTTNEAKENAIKTAYGEFWGLLKDKVNEDGQIDS